MKINLLTYKGESLGKSLKFLMQVLSDVTGATARGRRLNAEADHTTRLSEAQNKRDVAAIEEGLAEFRNGNLMAIAEKAIPRMEDIPNPGIEDPSWLALWLERAQDASDENVQLWWARILAGEAQSRGSFSKWALNTVACMSKDDIKAFTTVAKCVWMFGSEPEIVYWPSSRRIVPLAECRLERTGLVRGFGQEGVLEGYHHENAPQREAIIRYFGEQYAFRFPESLEVPRGTTISLTLLGKELYSLCDATANEEYKVDCIAQWRSKGVEPLGSS